MVFIGSQSAFHPQLPQSAYATSKGALQNAMYQLAKELGPHKIRLNMVVPTWMYGPPIQLYIGLVAQQRGITQEEVLAELTAKFPWARCLPTKTSPTRWCSSCRTEPEW